MPCGNVDRAPTVKQVAEAYQRIVGIVHRTPLVRSRLLSERAGCELFFKAENLQRAGAFKFRGAYNKIASLSESERQKGIIAFSSGNHAQGVALAAQMHGCKCTIVMPEGSSPAKVSGVRQYGAELVFSGPRKGDREARAQALIDEFDYTLVHPFADPKVIAGQGTIVLELLEQLPEMDVLVAPVGGGGLLSGCAIAAKALFPHVRVIGVEPQGADDAHQSFGKGKLTAIEAPASIADGLLASQIGELNWSIFRETVDDIVVVSEEEIKESMALLLTRTKLLAEPSGATAAAAVFSGRIDVAGQRVVCIVSGGNVDVASLGMYFGTSAPHQLKGGD